MYADLDRLISRRASQDRGPDPDELEPGYAESVRHYREREQRDLRAEWYAYHADQAERLRRTMEPLIAFHEARAAALLEAGECPPGGATRYPETSRKLHQDSPVLGEVLLGTVRRDGVSAGPDNRGRA